jgi:hypothetical protein
MTSLIDRLLRGLVVLRPCWLAQLPEARTVRG